MDALTSWLIVWLLILIILIAWWAAKENKLARTREFGEHMIYESEVDLEMLRTGTITGEEFMKRTWESEEKWAKIGRD